MFKINNGILFASIIALAFLVVSVFTISDYGISWDEPIHFMRGQGYLHYFLTGEIKYDTVPENRSYYQNDQLTAKYFLESDSGHPPLNGIFAAFSNYVFFQKLEILGDVESYHVFNIITATLLIFIVALFAFETFGFFASLASGLSLSLYPLFFGESRFNIKDPPEAAFFGLTIYAFWRAINSWSWKWLILSAVGFGLGLGTKFNILFLPFILIPWAIYKVFILDRRNLNLSGMKGKIKTKRNFLLALIISPVIILLIFVGSWPFLWTNPVSNLLEIFGFYKQIGTGFNYQTIQYYSTFGFNFYPILWIIFTTPPFILFLTFVGIIAVAFNFKTKNGAAILWVLWLIIPVIRVTLPNSSIYGGVRQIMEYIPAMALISGLGAVSLKMWLTKQFKVSEKLLLVLLLIGFLQILQVLIQLHPNENVYFNQLIGGLHGAKENNIPSWGNSFGNAYHQAMRWINRNTPKDSNLALIQGTGLNIYKPGLREDIRFNNLTWSGINRQGEYLLELTHQSAVRAYPYAWDYVERVLVPVYEVKVDGVAIAKVWKNDLKNSRFKFQTEEKNIKTTVESNAKKKYLMITLTDTVYLTRIAIKYPSDNCDKPVGAVSLSLDGSSFTFEPDSYPNEFVTEPDKKPNTIYQYFAVPRARFIKFEDKSENSCLFKSLSITVKGFE